MARSGTLAVMVENSEIQPQPRDTVPGFEVVLHVGRNHVVASVFYVSYKRGRRQLVSRRNHPLPLASLDGEAAWPAELAEYLTALIQQLSRA